MKIQKTGVVITEVPGVEKIELTPTENVEITFPGMSPSFFTIQEIGQFIEALQAIQREAGVCVWPVRSVTRIFQEGDIVPEDVTRVTDRDGDDWVKLEGDGWRLDGSPSKIGTSISDVLRLYAPLTEVVQ